MCWERHRSYQTLRRGTHGIRLETLVDSQAVSACRLWHYDQVRQSQTMRVNMVPHDKALRAYPNGQLCFDSTSQNFLLAARGMIMFIRNRSDDKSCSIRLIVLLLANIIFYTMSAAQAQQGFSGELDLRYKEGENFVLLKPFGYIDSSGIRWSVPAGAKADGASIPRILRPIIGPWDKYSKAAVIHDHYCVAKDRHWKAVHRVFLDGMLHLGVNQFQANLMYIAVYRFGPRWQFDADACHCKGCPTCSTPALTRIDSYQSEFNSKDLADLEGRLRRNPNDLEQLELLADFQLNSEIFR